MISNLAKKRLRPANPLEFRRTPIRLELVPAPCDRRGGVFSVESRAHRIRVEKKGFGCAPASNLLAQRWIFLVDQPWEHEWARSRRLRRFVRRCRFRTRIGFLDSVDQIVDISAGARWRGRIELGRFAVLLFPIRQNSRGITVRNRSRGPGIGLCSRVIRRENGFDARCGNIVCGDILGSALSTVDRRRLVRRRGATTNSSEDGDDQDNTHWETVSFLSSPPRGFVMVLSFVGNARIFGAATWGSPREMGKATSSIRRLTQATSARRATRSTGTGRNRP